MDSTNRGSCSTVVFTNEKYPRISGPTQFKPELFKGQPHFEQAQHEKLGKSGEEKESVENSRPEISKNPVGN